MRKLFVTHASDKYQSILLCEFSQWSSINGNVNRKPMLETWFTAEFEFQPGEGGAIELPDIRTTYLPGFLAFKKELKNKIFPNSPNELEFLPITVSNEPWLLLNCLQSVSGIDAGASDVRRGLNGEIYYVLRIRVIDPKARLWDIFTLQDSNRGQLFVTDEFRERVEKLGLKGIEFKEVGEII